MQKYTKNPALKHAVEKIVENFGRKWKNVEKYTYLCDDKREKVLW